MENKSSELAYAMFKASNANALLPYIYYQHAHHKAYETPTVQNVLQTLQNIAKQKKNTQYIAVVGLLGKNFVPCMMLGVDRERENVQQAFIHRIQYDKRCDDKRSISANLHRFVWYYFSPEVVTIRGPDQQKNHNRMKEIFDKLNLQPVANFSKLEGRLFSTRNGKDRLLMLTGNNLQKQIKIFENKNKVLLQNTHMHKIPNLKIENTMKVSRDVNATYDSLVRHILMNNNMNKEQSNAEISKLKKNRRVELRKRMKSVINQLEPPLKRSKVNQSKLNTNIK